MEASRGIAPVRPQRATAKPSAHSGYHFRLGQAVESTTAGPMQQLRTAGTLRRSPSVCSAMEASTGWPSIRIAARGFFFIARRPAPGRLVSCSPRHPSTIHCCNKKGFTRLLAPKWRPHPPNCGRCLQFKVPLMRFLSLGLRPRHVAHAQGKLAMSQRR